MIHYNFVYLDVKANKLVITQEPSSDKNFVMLMDNNGRDQNTLLSYCNTFCIGYMYGCGNEKPVNDIKEFCNNSPK